MPAAHDTPVCPTSCIDQAGQALTTSKIIKEDAWCSVQPGRQGSAGKRHSSSSGDVGWPKAAWYLKGMGRYVSVMQFPRSFECADMKFGTFCDL